MSELLKQQHAVMSQLTLTPNATNLCESESILLVSKALSKLTRKKSYSRFASFQKIADN